MSVPISMTLCLKFKSHALLQVIIDENKNLVQSKDRIIELLEEDIKKLKHEISNSEY